MMFRPPTVTASDSGRSRIPPQVGQGRLVMYRSISSRVASDPVSRYRRSRFGITPSNVVVKSWLAPERDWYRTTTRSPPLPRRTIWRASSLSSATGSSGEKRYRGDRVQDLREPRVGGRHPAPRNDGTLRIERLGSARTRSGSISSRLPSPVQTGQAPCGELNEKFLGAGSSNEPPCSGQA